MNMFAASVSAVAFLSVSHMAWGLSDGSANLWPLPAADQPVQVVPCEVDSRAGEHMPQETCFSD